MKVYFYDKETKEFTAEAEARKDPRASERLGKDVWLLPANATFDVPPVKESGKAVVFDNGWKQIADNRGKDIIKTDGTVVVVNYLGDLKDGDKLISAQEKAGLEDGSLIYKGGNIISKPALTDDEIAATRQALYESTSDPLFASYQQGVGTLQSYIDAKAQIGFDNKKSTQTAMTLDDFKHKVSREYQLFRQSRIIAQDITYAYKENVDTDDMVVGDETISLLRPTVGVNVRMPKVSKVQLVKVDNVSDDTVNIIPASGDNLDGSSSAYTLAGKSFVEFIADVASGTWDIYTAPLEFSEGINIEVGTNPSADRNGANNIKFGRGFTGYTDPNKNGVIVEVQDTDTRPVSYYASLSIPEEIVGRGSAPVHKGIVWFDNVVSAVRTNMMDIRMAEKSVGIQEYDGKDPNVTGGTPYLTVARISMRGRAPADGFVELSIIDKATGLPIRDENGAPLAVYKTYKEGDKLDVLRAMGVVKAKALTYLQVRVATSFPEDTTIFMNDYTSGNSCFMVVALDGNEVSETLLKYELDTGESIMFAKRYLGELYSTKFISSYDLPKTVGEAEQGETDADGSHFYNKYKMNVEVANNTITFSSFESELCFFNWGKIFDAEMTRLLRGQEVSVDAIITNPQGAFNIQMVKWTGNPDAYTTKIITDNVNASDVFEAGWEAVDSQFMAQSTERQASSKMFTVPDDAVNVAFLLTPIEVANPMEVSVHGFTIAVENPRTVWVVKGFKTVEEKQMSWRNDKVTTWTPLEGLQSYRFSGTDTPNKLPIGKLKEGDIPADLTQWKKVEGRDVGGVENDWAFYDDANIEVDAVVNLRVNTLGEVVYFFLTKDGKEIQGSRVSVTMSENTVDNALKVPTMKAKVSNGDLIGWSFQATTKDGAWLETDSVANPLATVTIRTEGAI